MNPAVTSASHVAVASGLGSAITTIFLWVLSLASLVPPANVADAFTVVITVGVSVLSSLVMKKLGVLSS